MRKKGREKEGNLRRRENKRGREKRGKRKEKRL